MANKKTTATRKRREKKNIERGTVHIQSTFNNTIVTIADMQGNAVSWASAVKWALGVPENQLLSLRRPLLKQQPKPLWSTV